MSALFDSQKEINLIEVFSSTAIGFIIALLIVIIIQKRYLYRLAIFLKLSNKHGDDDLWEYFFNIEEVDWIIVRDTNTKLIYQGAVIAYSQKDDKRELILSDVIVFSEGVEKLYEMSIIYFNFDINSNIIIEFDERNEINEGEKDNHNTRET